MQENSKKKTPHLANWLLSGFIKDELHEEFFGDLKEIYQDRILTKGKFYAILIYWVDVLHLLIGFTSLKMFKNQNNPTTMYKHYLLFSGRNLLRNKVYALINILSLAVGMGVCLVICQYVYFELSYDKFHDNYENTYRLLFDKTQNGVDQGSNPYVGYAVGVRAKEEIPEIHQYTRLHVSYESAVVTNPENNEPFLEDGHDLFFADKTFLQVFNFPLKWGSKESVFDDKFNIVITEKTAQKYFGADNPMGKILKINGGPTLGNYTVTGVLKNLPANSHLKFRFLLPMENYLELGNMGTVMRYDGWLFHRCVTYFTIAESANLDLVRKKLDQLIVKYKGKWNDPEHVVEKAQLQSIADIHLKSGLYANTDFVTDKGNIQDVRIFSLIAFFILFIAWVNYINLSTARSMHRAKEVGVRKSIGAFRRQLISQFMTESVLVNLIATLLAIFVAFLALPVLSGIIGKELKFSLLQIPTFWAWLSLIIILGSLLSGLYPSFVLSAFKPVSILRTGKTTRAGNINLRRGLIVFQFLISLLLISGTYLVYKQIMFMRNQALGIDMEQIVVLKGPKVFLKGPKLTDGRDFEQLSALSAFRRSTFQAFRKEVTDHHSVAAVTGSRVIPSQVYNTSQKDIRKLDEPPNAGQYGRSFYVGLDFPETYGLEFIAGSSFTDDMSDADFVIINEEAVKAYGFDSPENAIQEKLIMDSDPVTIVGVVRNFHWQSLKVAHTPCLLWFDGGIHDYISFKINLSNIQGSLAHIASTYDTFYPDNPFDYFFVDDAFNMQYQADQQFGNLFFAFTMLAIFIACVGLFALIAYSATLRVKEIGTRKVFGADTGNLMMLLSKEYLILISIAIIIAIPAILYYAASWLENYAFRIDIGLDLFIIPALVLGFISFLTVSCRTYSTAKTNPVESLRAE